MERTNEKVMTADQYVVKELLEAKGLVDGLKKENKQLQEDSDFISNKYQALLDLVKVAFSNSKVEEDDYVKVYINDCFIDLYDKEYITDEKKSVVALQELIELAHRLVGREE